MNLLTRLWKEEDGQALTEYGLLVGLIAVVVVGVVITLGTTIKQLFSDIITGLGGTDPKAGK